MTTAEMPVTRCSGKAVLHGTALSVAHIPVPHFSPSFSFPAFSGPAFSIPQFSVPHFWFLTLDIIGPAFSFPAVPNFHEFSAPPIYSYLNTV